MTLLIATNMTQADPVGELASTYLKRCGYTAATIASWTSATRLLQDIGLCGDNVADEFKILQDQFGVDLSGFEFDKYFPSELSTESFLLTLRPALRAVGLQSLVRRVCDKYPAVTLGMIDLMIQQKKWINESRGNVT